MNDMRKLMEATSALDYNDDLIQSINDRDRTWNAMYASDDDYQGWDWHYIKTGLKSEEEAVAVLKKHMKNWFDRQDDKAFILRNKSNPNYFKCYTVFDDGFDDGVGPRDIFDRIYKITTSDI